MSEQSQAELEFIEKMLRLANLQADTALKLAQHAYEPWKVVISAVTAGAALAGGLFALFKLLGM